MHDEQICGMSVICRFSIFTVGVEKAEGVNNAACVIYLHKHLQRSILLVLSLQTITRFTD